jgi:hypothetical protein
MQLMNENSRWDVSSIRTQFGEHIRAHIAVTNHMVNLSPRELFLELVYFRNVGVYGVLVDVQLLFDLLNHQ